MRRVEEQGGVEPLRARAHGDGLRHRRQLMSRHLRREHAVQLLAILTVDDVNLVFGVLLAQQLEVQMAQESRLFVRPPLGLLMLREVGLRDLLSG